MLPPSNKSRNSTSFITWSELESGYRRTILCLVYFSTLSVCFDVKNFCRKMIAIGWCAATAAGISLQSWLFISFSRRRAVFSILFMLLPFFPYPLLPLRNGTAYASHFCWVFECMCKSCKFSECLYVFLCVRESHTNAFPSTFLAHQPSENNVIIKLFIE